MNQQPILLFAEENKLTKRETELLQNIAFHGYSDEQIAEQLNIKTKTARNHMLSLLRKTNCASSRELLSKVITYILPMSDDQIATQNVDGGGKEGGYSY